MYLTSEDRGAAVVVTITTARLDSASAIDTREVLRKVVRDDRDVYLFDLSNVTFIDSSGIGTLVGFVKFVGPDKRVDLCAVTPPVRKIFRLTNLLSIFQTHQTVEDGLTAHQASRDAAAG